MLQVLLRLKYNTAVFIKKLNKPKDIKYSCIKILNSNKLLHQNMPLMVQKFHTSLKTFNHSIQVVFQ